MLEKEHITEKDKARLFALNQRFAMTPDHIN